MDYICLATDKCPVLERIINTYILDTDSLTARNVQSESGTLVRFPAVRLDERSESSETAKRDARVRRALQRYYAGQAMGGTYKLVTYTTPEWFEAKLLHRAWRMLVMRARRRGLPRQYYAVKEWNEKGTCLHLHVVYRCKFADIVALRSQWTKVIANLTGLPVVWRKQTYREREYDVAYVVRDGVEFQILANVAKSQRRWSSRKVGNYLAKYLSKALERRSYWYSYEWVYKAWNTFARRCYRWGRVITDAEHLIIRGLGDQLLRYKVCNRLILKAVVDYIRREAAERWHTSYEADLKIRLLARGVL